MHISTIDQYALLRRCPQLIQEILNLLGQAWYLGKNKRGENERGRGRGREREKRREREREREKEGERGGVWIHQFFHLHVRPGTIPSLETFENVMKVSQMVVQGMWSRGNNCLFQMPHITADQVKHFRTKKVSLSN